MKVKAIRINNAIHLVKQMNLEIGDYVTDFSMIHEITNDIDIEMFKDLFKVVATSDKDLDNVPKIAPHAVSMLLRLYSFTEPINIKLKTLSDMSGLDAYTKQEISEAGISINKKIKVNKYNEVYLKINFKKFRYIN